MKKAFGIVNPAGNHIWVQGLQSYRTIGAFSFLGRYRVIDFPISNLSNSGIEQIQVYTRDNPRSLVEHIGTGRNYNINSKSGKLRTLFASNNCDNKIYNTDIAAFAENLECIERMNEPYVVIIPSYMVYTQNFSPLIEEHIASGADITLLYHTINTAKEHFLNCDYLDLNPQNGVLSIHKNRGTEDTRKIFMDTYIMKTELFIELIKKAQSTSSMYTLAQIVNSQCDKLNILAAPHEGYFAAITDFKSYFDANISLISNSTTRKLFDINWPIYTRTNDSCPTKYANSAQMKCCVISNGCSIAGTVENSVVGRGCIIEEGAVVKNCVLLPRAVIGKNVHIENQVVDKAAKILHAEEIIDSSEQPGYIKRNDIL